MALLDTTLLVDLLRRRSQKHKHAQKKLAELGQRGLPLLTTRFNVAELYSSQAYRFSISMTQRLASLLKSAPGIDGWARLLENSTHSSRRPR